MKAIRVTQYGEPEVLQVQEVPLPEPGPGQARVRLRTAGVNFVDIYHRRGTYALDRPFTPGREGAGVVDVVGEGVTTVRPGERVAFTGHPGAYAEACLVPADSLIALPDDVSFEVGAAFPLQGMTAHYLLHEFHRPQPEEVVLVHAAAGGVGLLLVQWAKHLGARVIGTVSTEAKAKAARDAGADHVILYAAQDFVVETQRLTKGRGADLILDGVGKTTFAGNLTAAAVRGHIVIYGASSGPADPLVPNALMGRSLTVSGGSSANFLRTRKELLHRAGDVLAGIRMGWVRLRIDRTLPLEQAAAAHRALEGRETIGKVLLRVAGP